MAKRNRPAISQLHSFTPEADNIGLPFLRWAQKPEVRGQRSEEVASVPAPIGDGVSFGHKQVSNINSEPDTLNPFYLNHFLTQMSTRLKFYKTPFSFCVNLVKSCGFILKSTINNLQYPILNKNILGKDA